LQAGCHAAKATPAGENTEVENTPYKANRQADGPGGKETSKQRIDQRADTDIPLVSEKAPNTATCGADRAVSDPTVAIDRLVTEEVGKDSVGSEKSADGNDRLVGEQYESAASDGALATESDRLTPEQGSFDSTALDKGACGFKLCLLD